MHGLFSSQSGNRVDEELMCGLCASQSGSLQVLNGAAVFKFGMVCGVTHPFKGCCMILGECLEVWVNGGYVVLVCGLHWWP